MTLNHDRVVFIEKVWNNLRVPVRPGPEGLALDREQMLRFSEKKILVLGATPELVDLAVELDAGKVISIERDPDVIGAMRLLGKQDWRSVELIAGDWLEERPDFYSSFNCVVCDGGLLFLQYPGHWERLFKLVESYLVPGGVFVAKEWAETPGERNYESFVGEMIARFDAETDRENRQILCESYMCLASELRLATFINTTLPDGSFDQGILVERLDSLAEELGRRYPDSEIIEYTQGALVHLARTKPGTTDVITGVRFDGAQVLLEKHGFRAEHFPLPDRPLSGGNYMFVASKGI